jgi:hypothetical protein
MKLLAEAVAAFPKTGDAIKAEGAEPAVAELFAWAAAIGMPQDPAKVRGIRGAAASPNAAAWKNALAACEKAGKDLAGGAAPATVVEGLEGSSGSCPACSQRLERLQAWATRPRSPACSPRRRSCPPGGWRRTS